MKKNLLIIMLGFLLIGVSVYADGDLQVNGNIGVGTAPTTNKAEIVATDQPKTLQVTSQYTASTLPAGNNYSAFYTVDMESTGVTTGIVNAFSASVRYKGQGNPLGGLMGAGYSISLATSQAGPHLLNNAYGDKITLTRTSQNTQNVTLTNYAGIYSTFNATTGSASGVISGTDWKHINLKAIDDTAVFQPVSMSGIWIDKQVGGTANNYGIVLAGDGVGADIVFGASQQASIYSDSGLLYATDKNGFITQFSPHDPETGEWIFYSENTKTGQVMKVNMEKLVKAVEKLTGETFMVETLMEK